jgi:aldose 1-epimerase
LTFVIAAGAAQVEIAPEIGGAIASFRFEDRDVLRPAGDAARAAREVRGFSSYPLIPWSNRIADATLRLRGDAQFSLVRNFGDHPHAIHGVGWQCAWQVVREEDSRATLLLDYSPGTDQPAAWPFAFRAMQAFALRADEASASLTCTLSIHNADARPFPFGLGWHPFFPRNSGSRLCFRAANVWETEATCLPTRRIAIPAQWRFDPPRAVGDGALDNVFTGWDGEVVIDWPAERRSVTLSADAVCGHLVVYTPAERDYFAVEPVTHMTDAFNREAQGEPETGTRWIEPGEERSCTMRIVASSLASR